MITLLKRIINVPAGFLVQDHPSFPFHWKEGCLFTTADYDGKVSINSQCGQDVAVQILAPVDSPKLFLDLGANDGVNGSSTFLLEKMGWRGMLVEPNVNLIPSIIANRKYSYLLPCAVGDARDVMTLQTSDVHTLGSLVSDQNSYQLQRLVSESGGWSKIKKLPVAVLTMQDIINSFCDLLGAPPTFVKIDVEGYEEIVVRSFFSTAFRPPVIEIENNEKGENVAQILLSEGYILRLVMGSFVEIWSNVDCNTKSLLRVFG
ncbi:hypothetical protein PMIT1342_00212 [Prochlorococcus marinus str. MIT 1342]|uniref:FkbM family methyltransferase n=1 Tax=Prochlorococcus TaxID=1218 RepID=UPI0007B35E14|nr:FkbM family methyltransferase [Prochlorococcus marinus]KZR83894.1 hypothetical protein PMIT1342_00212 [Prochlorococcus marinus str. MIT 1342]